MNHRATEVSPSQIARILNRVAAIRSSADFMSVEKQILLVLAQECAAEAAELRIVRDDADRVVTVCQGVEGQAVSGVSLKGPHGASSDAARFELRWTTDAGNCAIVLRAGASTPLAAGALIPVQEVVARHAAEILETSYALADIEAARADLQQREALLRATRASLAVAHELGRTGNFRFNHATHSNWVSEEIFRFLGLDPRKTKMTLEVFQAGIHEDDRDRLLAETGEAFRNRTARKTHYRTRHPDGTVRYIMTSFRPANDEPDGDFIGTNVDLTDRRAAIERARAAQVDLARMLRLATLNELASSLIHGISQPLTAIVASAAAALRWLDQAPLHQEDVKASLAAINRSSDRVKNDVALLRSLASRAIPEPTLVPLDPVIKDVITLAVNEAERRGIGFDWCLGCGERQVLGDRAQVQQLFLSLATSAFRVADIGRGGDRRVSAATVPDPDGHVRMSFMFDASADACTAFDLRADTVEAVASKPDTIELWLSRTIVESYSGTLTLEELDSTRKQLVVRLPLEAKTSARGSHR